MEMIRHDDPRQQPIRFAVVKPQVFLDHLCQARLAQRTRAKAAIQHEFHPPELLPVIFQLHRFDPFVAEFGGNGIHQAICDELPRAGSVEMREVAARIPTFETLRLFFRSGLVMPLAFFSDDLMRALLSHGV